MSNPTVELKIEVMSDKTIKVTDVNERTLKDDTNNQALKEIEDPKELVGYLNKPIEDVIVTPMFTYFKTGSGVIIINGRAYYVP